MRCIIIGAGHAGVQAAHPLRVAGYKGHIELLDRSFYAPYNRPPLSKSFLQGKSDSSPPLKPPSFYQRNDISCRFGCEVKYVDEKLRVVQTNDGQSIEYDELIIATGSVARRTLPSLEVPSDVYSLVTLEDAANIRSALSRSRRAVIVGGGFIGLEVGHSLLAAGLEVVVIEREPRILQRVTFPEIAEAALQGFRTAGGCVVLEATISSFIRKEGATVGVRIEGGRDVQGDLIVCGIGATPNSEFGLSLDRDAVGGILVDDGMRTSIPSIYAIGDVATSTAGAFGGRRLESVPNAIQQAKRAAATICESHVPKDEYPWFWSDQGALKLQLVGLTTGVDFTLSLPGSRVGAFSILGFVGRRLYAVHSIDDPRRHVSARRICPTDADAPSEVMNGDVTVADRWFAELAGC